MHFIVVSLTFCSALSDKFTTHASFLCVFLQ